MTLPLATEEQLPQDSLHQRTRFGTRELLTAMLLSSVAFASQPAVGWKAAACMACVSLAIVMGWGSIALLGSCAALISACFQPQSGLAAGVCFAALLAIVFGPLVIQRISKRFTHPGTS